MISYMYTTFIDISPQASCYTHLINVFTQIAEENHDFINFPLDYFEIFVKIGWGLKANTNATSTLDVYMFNNPKLNRPFT